MWPYIGDITGDIYYDVLQITNKPVPFLRVYMMINETREAKEVKGLADRFLWRSGRTGRSASENGQPHPGRRVTSNCAKIRNDGIVVEVVAEHVIYIRNFDRERGSQRYERVEGCRKDPSRRGRTFGYSGSRAEARGMKSEIVIPKWAWITGIVVVSAWPGSDHFASRQG